MKNNNKTWALKVAKSTRLYAREQAKMANMGMSEWVEKRILEAGTTPSSSSLNGANHPSSINFEIISKQLKELSSLLYNHIHTPKRGWFS